jgi:hypothetical protein
MLETENRTLTNEFHPADVQSISSVSNCHYGRRRHQELAKAGTQRVWSPGFSRRSGRTVERVEIFRSLPVCERPAA